jgi:hypothetical protein
MTRIAIALVITFAAMNAAASLYLDCSIDSDDHVNDVDGFIYSLNVYTTKHSVPLKIGLLI